MSRKCMWCYATAEWQAHTVRHTDGIDLCQRHYDALQRDMRADSLARLSPIALDIVKASIP